MVSKLKEPVFYTFDFSSLDWNFEVKKKFNFFTSSINSTMVYKLTLSLTFVMSIFKA